jgi:shikimate dehydrogenase
MIVSTNPQKSKPLLSGLEIQLPRSPAMLLIEADAEGLRLIYKLFDLAVGGLSQDDLPRMVDALELAGFTGVNITHPFKQAVFPLLHGLSDESRAIGTVNTLLFQSGKRIGHDTD